MYMYVLKNKIYIYIYTHTCTCVHLIHNLHVSVFVWTKKSMNVCVNICVYCYEYTELVYETGIFKKKFAKDKT